MSEHCDTTLSHIMLTGTPTYGNISGGWGSLQKLVVPYAVITATHPHYQLVSYCQSLLPGHIQKTTTTHH